jgi:hypothetical protein
MIVNSPEGCTWWQAELFDGIMEKNKIKKKTALAKGKKDSNAIIPTKKFKF